MESNTTTTANEKFLQNQIRWVLPEIKTVLEMADQIDQFHPGWTSEDKAEYLESSLKAVHKRLSKVLDATGTKPSVFS